MTPKEKASELFNKMFIVEDPMGSYPMCYDTAIECALITVNEMIDFENRMLDEWTKYFEGKGGQMKIERLYWEEVKKELEKL